MKKKLKGLGLNCIAPGIGQFALKRPIRGCVMLFGTILAFIVGVWLIFAPIIHALFGVLASDANASESYSVAGTLVTLGVTILVMALVWAWSFLDIMIFKPIEEEDDSDEEAVDDSQA